MNTSTRFFLIFSALILCGEAKTPPKFPTIAGLGSVGIGFDIVTGSSASVGRRIVRLTYDDQKTWVEPFGNRTTYSVPDQITVRLGTTQFLGHFVARSLSEYTKKQSEWAGESAHYGGFFSESVWTSRALDVMKDSLHIIVDSRCKITLYSLTLDPAPILDADSSFARFVATLPKTYDAAKYAQLIRYYGTHFVSIGEFGGIAGMFTTISNSYSSYHSDSDIQGEASVSWGLFGGGGGGGSFHNETSQIWKDSVHADVYTTGGDPAIKTFYNNETWEKWAKSVELNAPFMIATPQLNLLSNIVNDSVISANIYRAIGEYVAAHNKTFPAPTPVTYKIGWCDCYGNIHVGVQLTQCKPGYFISAGQSFNVRSNGNVTSKVGIGFAGECCRPCFKAITADSAMKKKEKVWMKKF